MKARIGSVPYLNAKPLVEGLNSVKYEAPFQLAEDLRKRKLDAALVPVLEVLECPDYSVVEGVAIGSQNEVKSVFIAYEGALEKIKRIAIDPESKTSIALAKIIIERDFNLKVKWVKPEEKAEAQLMIGDKALNFRQTHPQAALLDLAQAWHIQRDLPFVFAVWAISNTFENKKKMAEQLRQAKKAGVGQLEKYGKTLAEEVYLKHNICYELGGSEKQAILRFQHELVALGLLKESLTLNWI